MPGYKVAVGLPVVPEGGLLCHVLAAFPGEFHIAAKLRAADGVSQGSDSQSFEQGSGRIVALSPPSVSGAHRFHRRRVGNPHLEWQSLLRGYTDQQHAHRIGTPICASRPVCLNISIIEGVEPSRRN